MNANVPKYAMYASFGIIDRWINEQSKGRNRYEAHVYGPMFAKVTWLMLKRPIVKVKSWLLISIVVTPNMSAVDQRDVHKKNTSV